MALEIRNGRAADIEILQQLARKTIRTSYPSFLGAAAVDSFIESGASDGYVEENVREALILLSDDTIVGFAVCKHNVVDLMMIHSDVHRRGLGTALLRHCEDQLFRSHGEIELESFRANDAANAFYRKNGWTQVREYTDGASGIPKLVLHKHRP